MCEGRVEVLQAIEERAFVHCPYCGMEVRRVISKASIKVVKSADPEAAAKKGFTTFRRAGKGVWEKIASPDLEKTGKEKVLNVDEELQKE